MRTGEGSVRALEWLAYSVFHAGDMERAVAVYDELLEVRSQLHEAANAGGVQQQAALEQLQREEKLYPKPMTTSQLLLCKAAALYALKDNKQMSPQQRNSGNGGDVISALLSNAEACVETALSSSSSSEDVPGHQFAPGLSTRLQLHLAHKMGKEQLLTSLHQKLSSGQTPSSNASAKEDQLSVAAMHFFRAHYQQATDIYKQLLLEHRDDLALNAYIAMCYYKLDYYEVSLEILAVYLQARPLSPAAINLKACNHFRLYNGKAAEAELKALADQGFSIENNALMRHNLVVFRNGENALRVFPPLIDIIPESKLNLVIYHLRQGAVADAYALIKDLEPSIPQEYILKAVVNAAVGQRAGSREHLKISQSNFHLVGNSPSECDTIPGRQCMASHFFLRRMFEDAQIYLSSIKNYLHNDDDFNWNYGITLAAVGNYKDAEETLLLLQGRILSSDFIYVAWLARCFIMNRKARQAWELYLRMDTSPDSLSLLQLIANDCYRTGAFYFSAKAFDVLERMDSDPEYWEGKRGACMGVFQAVVAGTEPREALRDVVDMLRNTQNQQVQFILGVISRWATANGGI
jgi:intraflagellar transport protein 56